MDRGVTSSVDSDFIFERASELIYQGRLDEEVLDRFEVLVDKMLPRRVQSPLRLRARALLEIVRLERAGVGGL